MTEEKTEIMDVTRGGNRRERLSHKYQVLLDPAIETSLNGHISCPYLASQQLCPYLSAWVTSSSESQSSGDK